jgi:hypothetical protein
MKAGRIHPQKVATSTQMAAQIPDQPAADNFRNLFETPVLFYLAIAVIYAAKLTSPAYVILAWLYVGARSLHSAIHCGSNVVMQRFRAFLASLILLVLLWGVLAYDLLILGKG